MWRSGGCRPNISVATPFVWRCLCLTGLPRSSRAPRLLSGACGSVSTAFQSAGTVSGIANTAEDHRAADLIKHTVSGLVGQRVFGIVLGYEDLIDHDQLRHDPVMALGGKLEASRADCAPLRKPRDTRG